MDQEEIINKTKEKILGISETLLSELEARVRRLPILKRELETRPYHRIVELVTLHALFFSIEKLNELIKDLNESSKRLEKLSNDMVKWNKVLIFLTIVLAVLAAALILRTV